MLGFHAICEYPICDIELEETTTEVVVGVFRGPFTQSFVGAFG